MKKFISHICAVLICIILLPVFIVLGFIVGLFMTCDLLVDIYKEIIGLDTQV